VVVVAVVVDDVDVIPGQFDDVDVREKASE